MLKRDWGSDTEIGKCVCFKTIDLTWGKKFWKKYKESILWFDIKGKSARDILESQWQELKKSNILIITSNHKAKISDKEKNRLKEVIEILASLELSRVSVLKGGLKNYLANWP